MEMNSTNATIDAKRNASSLPAYFDDAEKENQQKNLLVGSLQAGNKVTKSGGELEKLGGLVITKNFDTDQKVADKVIQGRANILVMDPDPDHEQLEAETLSNFHAEHVNALASVFKPLDFVARLYKNFFKLEGAAFTKYQDFQVESTEIISNMVPEWRNRKSNAFAHFISTYTMVGVKVVPTLDEVSQRLNVEAFLSREEFINLVLEMIEKTKQLEEKLSKKEIVKETEDASEDVAATLTDDEGSTEIMTRMMNNVVRVLEEENDVEKSKYLKHFKEINGDWTGKSTIGVYAAGIEKLAKKKGLRFSKFPRKHKLGDNVKSTS